MSSQRCSRKNLNFCNLTIQFLISITCVLFQRKEYLVIVYYSLSQAPFHTVRHQQPWFGHSGITQDKFSDVYNAYLNDLRSKRMLHLWISKCSFSSYLGLLIFVVIVEGKRENSLYRHSTGSLFQDPVSLITNFQLSLQKYIIELTERILIERNGIIQWLYTWLLEIILAWKQGT